MKKIYFKIGFIFIISFLYYNITNAENIVYTEPTFWDISQNLNTNDIEPWYNPQPSYRIWIYEDYILDGVADSTAQRFCEVLEKNLVNYILDNNNIHQESALYYPANSTWWNYNKKILQYSEIICYDDTGGGGTTWTGTIIINNISNDVGINKKIFDTATITEIYEYEALIMVFILLFTFWNRVIWKKPKGKTFFI